MMVGVMTPVVPFRYDTVVADELIGTRFMTSKVSIL